MTAPDPKTTEASAGPGDAFARVVAFDRALHERAADRAVPTRFGRALFLDAAPRSWDLNHLAVEQPGAGFAELAADAARAQAALPTRVLLIDAEVPALAADAVAAGWGVDRHVAMVATREPDHPPALFAEEVPAPTILPARHEALRSDDFTGDDEALVADIERADAAVTAALESERAFASFAADGWIAAFARLFSAEEGGVAQIEDVATLAAHRGQGHARAVVSAALAASRAAGHEITFLWADEDDWPVALYRRLGFEVVGRRWRLRDREPGAPPEPR